jgi:hypothetical protein
MRASPLFPIVIHHHRYYLSIILSFLSFFIFPILSWSTMDITIFREANNISAGSSSKNVSGKDQMSWLAMGMSNSLCNYRCTIGGKSMISA